MNKKIGVIAVDLTPILPGGENGGAKIFVLDLLSRLVDLAPQTQFILLTQAASHEELSSMDRPNMRRLMVVGCPVEVIPERSRLQRFADRIVHKLRREFPRLMSRLGRPLKPDNAGSLLQNINADLLFCPFTAPTYFEAGITTVCTIYDLQYKTYAQFFAVEDVAHRDRTFTEACRRATALAAISDYSRDSAITHGKLNPSLIRTIHLRMAQRIVPNADNDTVILARLKLTPERYLIYPANFWKHKNHEMLLTAFGMACDKGLPADIKLVCTGAPGARQAFLMSAVQAMKLNERVLFPGYVSNAELTTLMANSTGVVFPSLYEGFGLPVIEAMAAGVPVACSNLTSLPEVAADATILFDPRVPTHIADAMVALVEDAALRTQLVQAGYQRAIEFSDSERMAREYWALFLHAFANVKHENLLTGVYADGWIGRCLSIQVAPSAHKQTLSIELSAPEWLTQKHFTAKATQIGKNQEVSIAFDRGTNAILSVPLETSGGCYEVKIDPFFVPAQAGHGDDHRELTVMLQKCCIVGANGSNENLYPEKV
jgi:glycosyltransferase involved in cell wall biosynthesis